MFFSLSVDNIFNPYWCLLFSAFLVAWASAIIFRRKKINRSEIKQQLIVSAIGLPLLACMEIYAVSVNLWNYTPENWPVLLWPTYYVAILFGFQLVMLVQKMA
jgi:hypothetical protein